MTRATNARRPVRQPATLSARLDSLVERFDLSMIVPDPLELVLRYKDPLDQEVAALIAAAFAYGRADIVVRNAGAVLEKMTPSPWRYLTGGPEGFAGILQRGGRPPFRGFTHRFHKTGDLILLLERISFALGAHGTIGALFESCFDPADPDIGPSWSDLSVRSSPVRRILPINGKLNCDHCVIFSARPRMAAPASG